MSRRSRARTGAVLILSVLAGLAAARGEFDNPKAKKPPRAKPLRRTAAVGVPPLPLPATPLRRSERKRQPAPPALVGWINFSEKRFQIVEGQRRPVAAFPTTQIDIERLMRFANVRLKIRYRFVPTDLKKFSWDPTELPLLYVTGWTPMPALSQELIGKLRRYLYDGGTLVVHAQCGRHEFIDTALREMVRIFPDRELADIDPDSPLYHAFYPIGQMRVRVDDKPFQTMRPPFLKGIYLGCRPTILFSPIDLNCGWDVVKNPIMGGTLFHQDDACRLGINIITTVLANFEYARAWGTRRMFHQQDEKTRDQLVIAQIRHSGDWDPTPHALPTLMKYIREGTTLNVQFKRQEVELGDVDVFKHPVLYMTGLRDFTLTETEVARLRKHLRNGGVLIADAAAGRLAFDRAFRREIKRILPDGQLKTLPLDSPVYEMPHKLRTVEYSEIVKAQSPTLNAPSLEGISLDGQLCVIYSPLSLSNGWERLPLAYNRGYGEADALRLGVNLFSYALTH